MPTLCHSIDGLGDLHIIFVYATMPNVCSDSALFPKYIRATLKQALVSQPGSHLYFGANFDECPQIRTEITDHVPEAKTFDILLKASNRTKDFISRSKEMFSKGNNGLWILSATRFFHIEDMMIYYNISNVLHVEADNMLYGQIGRILPELRKDYPHLAVTPTYSDLSTLTASVMWIKTLEALEHFNELLIELSTYPSEWAAYTNWLRRQRGRTTSEMTVMGYYRFLYHDKMGLFPVISGANNFTYSCLNSKHSKNCHLNKFKPNGGIAGANTGEGIWDSGSWGQFIGGTPHANEGRGFMEAVSVVGEALMANPTCVGDFLCSSRDFAEREFPVLIANLPPKERCVLAPFMRCAYHTPRVDPVTHEIAVNHIYSDVNGHNSSTDWSTAQSDLGLPWTFMWNLHVHSKRTKLYVTKPCNCSSSSESAIFHGHERHHNISHSKRTR